MVSMFASIIGVAYMSLVMSCVRVETILCRRVSAEFCFDVFTFFTEFQLFLNASTSTH